MGKKTPTAGPPHPGADPQLINLATLVRNRGFKSLRALAEAAGVSLSTVNFASRGMKPGPGMRTKLAAALRVTDDELVAAISNALPLAAVV